MTTETSRNADYAPFSATFRLQAPVPQTTHNLPASIPANNSVQTSLIRTGGYSLISAGITATQAGTLSIQRYLDDGGTQVQGAPISIPLAANTPSNLDVLDGLPFASFILTAANGTASVSTITGFALLLQSSDANNSNTATDASGTITTGGTAQTLFGGIVPSNGFAVYNPDATNDLWISDTVTALANGTGSIRVVANGGGFETPPFCKPCGVVSIVGATTGQKFTARRW
ncbi:MAG: hypothetical protein WC521_02750 [Bdellovibrionales bacterium]